MLPIPALALLGAVVALDNGLTLTPQMGYNSWYNDECNLVSEQLQRETIDAMVANGFVALGYKHYNLDDCWAKTRLANGTVVADPALFPSGTLKPLADYAHANQMHFGTYTDRGTNTCAGRPGALGYEVIDAETYAAWGVDYLKEDSCNAADDHQVAFEQYGKMRDALNATNRPIVFSLCGWNSWYAPVGYSLGNSWRIGPDDTNWAGVLANIDINSQLAEYAGPGGFNDPCLLLAEDASGNLRMTQLQSRTQFSMWAIMASPLLISANVRNMSAFNMETYKNSEVIAVNQDPLGKQGTRILGGNLSPGAGGNPPATLAECNSADPSQQWALNEPAAGYLLNKASNLCLNVDNCGTDLIFFDCVTTGGTCCGANCYQNMQFNFSGGALISPMQPTLCASSSSTATPGSVLNLVACNASDPRQAFAFNPNAGGLVQQDSLCLSTAASSPAATNVWARELANGAWAVIFVNAGPAPADITCDEACLEKLTITEPTLWTVRDLWAHASVPFTARSFTAAAVPPNGGSLLVKFTPA